MDSSDRIAKLKAKAIYFGLKTQFVTAQPSADCGISTCGTYSTCVTKFESYAVRRAFKVGRDECNGCSCASGSGFS